MGDSVDQDHVLKKVRPLHAAAHDLVALLCVEGGLLLIQLRGERLVNDLVDERRFARSGHSGDRDHHVQRDFHVDVFQVVRARTEELQCPLRHRLAALRYAGNLRRSVEVLRGERLGTIG